MGVRDEAKANKRLSAENGGIFEHAMSKNGQPDIDIPASDAPNQAAANSLSSQSR
jgi:hypothetical protein